MISTGCFRHVLLHVVLCASSYSCAFIQLKQTTWHAVIFQWQPLCPWHHLVMSSCESCVKWESCGVSPATRNPSWPRPSFSSSLQNTPSQPPSYAYFRTKKSEYLILHKHLPPWVVTVHPFFTQTLWGLTEVWGGCKVSYAKSKSIFQYPNIQNGPQVSCTFADSWNPQTTHKTSNFLWPVTKQVGCYVANTAFWSKPCKTPLFSSLQLGARDGFRKGGESGCESLVQSLLLSTGKQENIHHLWQNQGVVYAGKKTL